MSDKEKVKNFIKANKDFKKYSLRQIGKLLGISHPQTVKYYLLQLGAYGSIVATRRQFMRVARIVEIEWQLQGLNECVNVNYAWEVYERLVKLLNE